MKNLLCAKTLAVVGLLFLSSNAPALCDDRMSFREFRDQNAGIDRRAARQMFHQQFGRGGNGGGSPMNGVSAAVPIRHVISVGPNGEIVCGDGRLAGLRGAQEARVRNQSMQRLMSGDVTRVNRGAELDLESSTRNIVLGRGLFANGATVDVTVAGKTQTFGAGQQVTAAEYVAVKQVLSGGGQQIEVDRTGRASGGTIDLGSLTSGNDVMRASSLNVPVDVTAYGDFGRQSDFRLTGDLSNKGTMFVSSSDQSVRGGGIHADNITNHTGGFISSEVDLSLNAARNLSNDGVITSQGSLTLSGETVTNKGAAFSNGDLTINSSSVTNRGALNSSANVNFNGSPTIDLVVNNSKGVVDAAQAINLRDAAFSGSGNSYLMGGDLFSRDVNLNSGLGTANVNVNELTGTVHETGSAAHVAANTTLLNVGTICLTGDPTFYNTAGDITIVGNIDVQEDLVFIASGNIAANPGLTIQARDANQGYNITFISGASFTVSGGNDVTNVGPVTGAPPYANSGTVTVTAKGSKTGGGILIGVGTTLSSRSTGATGDDSGGNIELIAFGKNNGRISTADAFLVSGGKNAGANGNISLIAGASSDVSIFSGITDATGGTGPGGSIIISASPAAIIGGKSVVYDDTGTRTSLAQFVPGKLSKDATIRLIDTGLMTNDTAANETLLVQTGGTIELEHNSIGAGVVFRAGFGMFSLGGNSITGTERVDLETGKGGLIGDPFGLPVIVDTPELNIFSEKGLGTVLLVGIGITEMGGFGSELLFIEAAVGRDIRGGADARQLALVGDNIGNSGDRFILGPNVEVLLLDSTVDVFLDAVSEKRGIAIANADVNNLDYRAAASIGIVGNVTATGSLDFVTTRGSIVLEDDVVVSAVDHINMTNSSTKGKFIFEANSQLLTNAPAGGAISLTLGAGGGGTISTPSNINVSETPPGQALFFGFAPKVKGEVSTINAKGADVSIDNTVKSNNFLLKGNVLIEADPPVGP